MPTKAPESPALARNAVKEYQHRSGQPRDAVRPPADKGQPGDVAWLIDPFASYKVAAYNEKFDHEIHGVEFARGKATIDALPAEWKGPTWGYPANTGVGEGHELDLAPEADWQAVQDRIKALEYFANAHEVRKDVYKFNEETGNRDRVGTRTYPQFIIERLGE